MSATAVIAYRRRASPLHAARATSAAAYGFALAACALLVQNPILLAALALAVVGASAAAGIAPALWSAARRAALPLLTLTVLVNALVSREGLTVLARLGDWGVLGQVDVTLEAVVYGLVFGLRLLVVMLACVLVVCTADPDGLLFALRRVAPRSALTAALATRLLPVLAQDARRLADAQLSRRGAAPRGARSRLAILRATVAGALDRSLDVAAVLEMRGYGDGNRRRAAPRPRSRHDVAFTACALCLLALCLLAALTRAGGFSAYPLLGVATGPSTILIAGALPLLALLPFADRRGIEP